MAMHTISVGCCDKGRGFNWWWGGVDDSGGVLWTIEAHREAVGVPAVIVSSGESLSPVLPVVVTGCEVKHCTFGIGVRSLPLIY